MLPFFTAFHLCSSGGGGDGTHFSGLVYHFLLKNNLASKMERLRGLEPRPSVWKTEALPITLTAATNL